MPGPSESGSQRREAILSAAIPVFGRFGFKKTSVDDIAAAAGISKQGLYLHFTSKEEVFLAALQKYLDDGLNLVEQALTKPNTSLFNRLVNAMDAWFGRHVEIFKPESFDVIEASHQLAGNRVEEYKSAVQTKIAKALAESPEFKATKNVCTPKEVSHVLFSCGLAWKGNPSRTEFIKRTKLYVRACCQLDG